MVDFALKVVLHLSVQLNLMWF